jgi:Acyl-CoA reductase (LuxC)
MTLPVDGFLDARTFGTVEVIRLPAIVRGKVRMPAWPRVGEVREAVAARPQTILRAASEDAYLLARPLVDRDGLAPTDEMQVLVVPAPDPRELVEPDPAAAVHELMRLPLDQVCALVDAVGDALAGTTAATELYAATSFVGDRMHAAVADQIRGLFDGGALRRMLDAELGTTGARALDTWVAASGDLLQGVSARMAMRDRDLQPPAARAGEPLLRAVPTTQLHITAGNAPVVPVTSLLWAWSTKGASVLKPAAEAVPLVAGIGAAIVSVDPSHPLARHTTLAYWRGGDARVEDVLLAEGAFDRRLVWGTDDAIRAIGSRGDGTDTILMRPRHAISLIGRKAVESDLDGSARLAASDSVVADQQACMSSLLHLIEGDAADADAYALALARVLSRWDQQLPHRTPDSVQGRMVGLRRGLLATAQWHINGTWPRVSSAVVRLDRPFDLRRHPGGRLVLVRAVPSIAAAIPGLMTRDISHVGVTPAQSLNELRDLLVSLGVDNVLPLGEAERVHAGRSHDGMRVLNRLVRWVNA